MDVLLLAAYCMCLDRVLSKHGYTQYRARHERNFIKKKQYPLWPLGDAITQVYHYSRSAQWFSI